MKSLHGKLTVAVLQIAYSADSPLLTQHRNIKRHKNPSRDTAHFSTRFCGGGLLHLGLCCSGEFFLFLFRFSMATYGSVLLSPCTDLVVQKETWRLSNFLWVEKRCVSSPRATHPLLVFLTLLTCPSVKYTHARTHTQTSALLHTVSHKCMHFSYTHTLKPEAWWHIHRHI